MFRLKQKHWSEPVFVFMLKHQLGHLENCYVHYCKQCRKAATRAFDLLLRGACTMSERIQQGTRKHCSRRRFERMTYSGSFLAEISVRSPGKLFIYII